MDLKSATVREKVCWPVRLRPKNATSRSVRQRNL